MWASSPIRRPAADVGGSNHRTSADGAPEPPSSVSSRCRKRSEWCHRGTAVAPAMKDPRRRGLISGAAAPAADHPSSARTGTPSGRDTALAEWPTGRPLPLAETHHHIPRGCANATKAGAASGGFRSAGKDPPEVPYRRRWRRPLRRLHPDHRHHH